MSLPSMALLLLLFLHPLAASPETAALLSFKAVLSDPSGALSSWNDSSHTPCKWLHVACNVNNRVTSLTLSSLNLAGPISPSLARLPHLVLLDLSGNSLTGPIPDAFSNFSSLKNLSLSSNSLSGPIPASLSRLPLTLLRLTKNNLTGTVPSWLGRSPTLLRIYLSSNYLTGTIPSTFCTNVSSPLYFLDLTVNNLVGTIPPTLGNCSNLSYLLLAANSLTGAIPPVLGFLPNIKTLDLSSNNLVGAVPRSVYNMSSMIYFSTGLNMLEGVLPDNIGLAMPQMQAFEVQGNKFHGRIPKSLGNATMLYIIDLSSNRFSGEIDVEFGGLQRLYELSLADNQLVGGEWGFLESLANCSRLRWLILSKNLIEGSIPAKLGNLSRTMEWLELDDNRMTGTIPSELGNLFNITLLDLSNNNFSGEIPTIIGNLNVLQDLNLSYNSFSGQIPTSISKLTYLSELYLQSNSLNGTIPPSLGLNKNLAMINLSHNHLHGTIPKELLSMSSLSKALDLSHNSLSGPIPPEVKSLTNLVILDLSHNQLSGAIPSTLGSCDELQYLYMQSNNLSGSIPETLTRLNLDVLDLSFNDLEGQVPVMGVFKNSTIVSVIGNGNLCGGDPALHLQTCNRPHRSRVLKMIIIICASVAGVLLLISMVTLYAVICLKRQKRRTVATSTLPVAVSGEDKYIKVSYNELYKATNGFSPETLVGSGGFGSVYRGRINGYDKEVAVKVLNLEHHGAMKSFTAECEALRSVRHRSLVKVVTSCSTIDGKGDDFRALVFEFMPNGNLDERLHGEVRLGLDERMVVAIDVGSALEYLHEYGETPIVHCDLKPSNVLLDQDMNAQVGDFGLARFLKGGVKVPIQGYSESVAVKGTIGYVAPEYGTGGQLSTRGDVYSYGILLLEMLTGRRPTDPMPEEGVDLRKFVEAAYPERVMKIADSTLFPWEDEGDIDYVLDESNVRARVEQCLVSIFRVGLLCSKETASERMEMRDVVPEMQAIRATYRKGF